MTPAEHAARVRQRTSALPLFGWRTEAGMPETEWQRRTRRARERAEHVAEHGPACQICGNVPKRGLDQDHDHRTGETRGWLCHRCNRALPSWVTEEWLLEATRYLRASKPCICRKSPPNGAIGPDPKCPRHGYTLVNADYLEART